MVLKTAIAMVLVTPLGLSVGTLFGIITDYGPVYTAENIRLNPGTFANQYARMIVFTGWASWTIRSESFG